MKNVKYLLIVLVGVVLGFGTTVLADRSAGGVFTYTLPGGPVARTGDTISSNWANSSLTEIQTALSDSLSRSGKGGMSAGLKLIDGSASGSPGPSLYFSSGTNTGLYYSGAPATLHAPVSGADVQAWTAAGTSITGTADVSGVFTAAVDVAFNSTFSVGKAGNGRIDFGLSAPSTATVTAANGLRILGTADSLYGSLAGSTARFGVYDTISTLLVISNTGTTFSPDQVVGGIATPVSGSDAANKTYVDGYATTFVRTPTWTALTGGGTGCTWVSPAYTKAGGITYLRGSVTCTTGTAVPTLSSIQQYFRPGNTKKITGLGIATTGTTRVSSQPSISLGVDGVFTISAVPDGGDSDFLGISLDGVSFPAEQ